MVFSSNIPLFFIQSHILRLQMGSLTKDPPPPPPRSLKSKC